MAARRSRERGTTPVRKPDSKSSSRAGKSSPRANKSGKSNKPYKPDSKSRKTTNKSRQPANLGGTQVEGRQSVRELLLADRRTVREVFLVAGQDPAEILDDIIDLADEAKIPIRQISRSRFETLTHTDAAQGVIAKAAPIRPTPLEDLVRPSAFAGQTDSAQPTNPAPNRKPFLILVDKVTDPHNLGALMRTAEAAGVTGFVLSRHQSSRISPTVTKAAAGAVEHLPMAQVNSIAGAVRDLQKLGVWVVGLDEAADTSIWDMNLAAEPVALVLGSEGKGLSRLVKQNCDLLVAIPLSGVIASLNVAAAGAIATFAVQRQRQN